MTERSNIKVEVQQHNEGPCVIITMAHHGAVWGFDCGEMIADAYLRQELTIHLPGMRQLTDDESETCNNSESLWSFVPSEERKSSWTELIRINTNSDFCNKELESFGCISFSWNQTINEQLTEFGRTCSDGDTLYLKKHDPNNCDSNEYDFINEYGSIDSVIIIKQYHNALLKRQEISFCEYFSWADLCIKYTYIIALSKGMSADTAIEKFLSFRNNIQKKFTQKTIY
jgi:hypothetical protein